jgi:hypothetical protein
MSTVRKYNRASLDNIITELEAWIEQSEDTLGNEESRDYPNEDRLDMLQTRIDQLQQASEALQGID